MKKSLKVYILMLMGVIILQAQDITSKLGGNDATATYDVTDSGDNLLFRVQGDAGALFFGNFETGAIPVTGEGTRMMWYPAKAAFRVGYVNDKQWDADSIGDYSVAMGYNTIASGKFSTAMGANTTSSGYYSTAMGVLTEASGYRSTAMGSNTIASGELSTAIGKITTASGNFSTAMGYNTTASGNFSTAMGRNTKAEVDYSTAMGQSTTASGASSTAMGNNTTASGAVSTAMGLQTTASGYISTAMGYNTTASGDTSIAMGSRTTAGGEASTAMGYSTTASGHISTAIGYETKAESYISTAIGRYNVGGGTAYSWIVTEPLFEIGNGTGVGYENNAVTVLKNGNVGIGTTSQFGGGTGILSLKNAGTNPTIVLTNAAALYSSSGELYAYDVAGNATKLSPHDKETGEWIFYSKNTTTGRVVKINMEKLVKAVEELTGESFMDEWVENL